MSSFPRTATFMLLFFLLAPLGPSLLQDLGEGGGERGGHFCCSEVPAPFCGTIINYHKIPSLRGSNLCVNTGLVVSSGVAHTAPILSPPHRCHHIPHGGVILLVCSLACNASLVPRGGGLRVS